MWRKMVEVLLIAFFPLGEVRASVPIGIYYNLSDLTIVFLSLTGGMLATIIGLIIFNLFIKYLNNIKIIEKYVHKKIKEYKKSIDKYGKYALVFFVGIPIPGTGVWTAALISSVLEMDILKSFFYITLGNMLATLIVLIVTRGLIYIL